MPHKIQYPLNSTSQEFHHYVYNFRIALSCAPLSKYTHMNSNHIDTISMAICTILPKGQSNQFRRAKSIHMKHVSISKIKILNSSTKKEKKNIIAIVQIPQL
ncbi:hypothetical protein ACP275_05G024600 [Erythranthe tilingii]